MSISNAAWYAMAWDGIWNSATDYEAEAIESAAVRAGILWKCSECLAAEPSYEKVCTDCGQARTTGDA